MVNDPLRILYIDDSLFDRELVHNALVRENPGRYVLTEASSRKELEDCLAHAKYDLVLSDFNILGFDGLEVLELVSKMDPALPIIIVTGTGSEEVAAEAMKRGAGDYVIKTPSHIQRLPQTIGAVLEKRSLENERHQSVEDLRQANEELSAIIKEAPVAVITLDLKGDVQTWNPMAERLIGWTANEALGKPFILVSTGKTVDFKAFLDKALKGDIVNPVEVRRQRQDGSWWDAEVYTTPLHDPSGNPTGLLAMLQDITERKRAEQKILDLARFPSENPNPVVRISQEGIILYANPASEPLLAFWNCQVGDRMQKSDRERILARIEIGQNEEEEISFKGQSYTLMLTPIKEAGYVNVYARNITLRKQAEDALRTSETKFRILVENIPQEIFSKDRNSVYLSCNDNYARDLSITPDEIVGRTDDDFYPREMANHYREEDRRVMDSGKAMTIEEKIILKGEELWIQTTKSPIRDKDGAVNGVLGIFLDITERKRSEQALVESELRLKLALGAAQMGAWEWDIKTNVVYWSPECIPIMGLNEHDLTIEAFTRLIHPEDVDRVMQASIRAVEEKKQFSIEYRVIRSDGELRWLSEFGQGKYDENGNPLTLIGTVQDITERKRAEETLRESEERFRALTLSLNDAVVIADYQDRIIFWNKSASKLFQYTDQEVLGKQPSMLMPEIQIHRISEMINQLQARGINTPSGENIKGLAQKKDGTQFPVEISHSSWGTGNAKYSGTIIRDITARLQAEEALRQSEQRLALHIQETPLAVIEFDPHHNIVHWNLAAEHIFGYTAREAIGQHALFLVPESARAQVLSILDELESVKGGDLNMNENITKDRRLIQCVWHNTTLVTPEGKLIGIASMVEDITEEVQARKDLLRYRDHLEELVAERTAKLVESETSLRKRSEEISDLYNNAPCGYQSLDENGTFLQINDTELSWLGYSRDELIGKRNITDFIPFEYHANFQELFETTKTKGGMKDIEGELIRKDGTHLRVLINTNVVIDEKGNYIMSRDSLTDNTERQKAEMAMREAKETAENANQAKTTFLANMSHEIRTPMNAILGFSQLMLRDPELTATQQKHLETINRSGKHLMGLINDILEMSKVEANSITLNPTTIDLHTMIQDLEIMFKMRSNAKSLEFLVEMQRDLPLFVVTDETKLYQIFVNLLANAVKFTERGRITWRIFGAKNPKGSFRLVSEVEDTGPGIPTEELGLLFKPFGQTSSGLKTIGGTGLGLAISWKIARLMGGELSVRSEVGKGSTFRLEIELEEGKNEDLVGRHPSRRVIRLKPGQPECRILVVDDQLENRELAVELLNRVGFLTEEATNGEEAVHCFETWKPNLILMDMRMPVMDGYAATRAIKGASQTHPLPIIALSAYAFADEQLNILSAGADGYIRKPFTEHELFETIASFLGVQYLYEDDTHLVSEPMPAEWREKLRAAMAEFPLDYTRQVRQAIMTANLDQLLQLIDQVAEQSPQTAVQMREWANNFRYDQLLELLPG